MLTHKMSEMSQKIQDIESQEEKLKRKISSEASECQKLFAVIEEHQEFFIRMEFTNPAFIEHYLNHIADEADLAFLEESLARHPEVELEGLCLIPFLDKLTSPERLAKRGTILTLDNLFNTCTQYLAITLPQKTSLS